MIRKPIVAGMFYKEHFEELDKEINYAFKEDKFGPGDLPVKKRDKEIIGIIAPHAGYVYSGAGQAWCYKEIGESKLADVYVIIGTNHSSIRTCVTKEDFETPFGIVRVNGEFAETLMKHINIKEDNRVHNNEHSIEVQLPFLQFVNRDYLKQIRIVPIAVSSDIRYEDLARAIVETASELDKKICVICSSDFTHYGINYGYMPFHDKIKENLENLDMGAIKYIKDLDSFGFVNYVEETGATICGYSAIAVFIEIAKLMKASMEVLHYYTSGDVIKDYSSAVGYGSIVARK
jgi:hypothetical protein